VLQTFDETTTGATELTGGELAPAVYALALAPLVDTRRLGIDAAVEAVRQESALYGAPGWRNPWSADARRHFRLRPPPELLLRDADGGIAGVIAQRVWQPLQARAGALWGGADALRVDCCIVAALDDWVRVGEVLLQSGTYEGQRLASPDWIRALLAADLQQQRHPVWLREHVAGAAPCAVGTGVGVRRRTGARHRTAQYPDPRHVGSGAGHWFIVGPEPDRAGSLTSQATGQA
jgi:hypothetical protein